MGRGTTLARAERELEAALRGSGGDGDGAVQDLARSQRVLTEELRRSRRMRKATDPEIPEEEDEVDEQQEDFGDPLDEEAVEDQDPDDPDEGTGLDDVRGTVGRRKNNSRQRSRRRKERDHETLEASRRRKQDEDDDDEDDDDDDEEEMERSRRRRDRLNRARPRWAGRDEALGDDDEDEEDDEDRDEEFRDVYARGHRSYLRNEDANHEEDERVPPDGPDVADGDDEDQYTIGSHRVHSERAMRRSRGSREKVYRSFARIPGAEDAISAEPFLAELVDQVAAVREELRKSRAATEAAYRHAAAQSRVIASQGRVIARLHADMQLVKAQPVTAGTPWGVPLMPRPQGQGNRGGRQAAALTKSRVDIITGAEQLLRSGRMDSQTFQALGSAATAEDVAALLTPEQQQALGLGGVR